ncbi:MAG: patatin-like phospholipase family protein [Burkholderiaceae bacterium]|jgi:hypothetical protein|nr:patatin-like phospholipase family protein [Burkholderiaceae bacterium]
MKALCLYAGAGARDHLLRYGLQAQDVRIIPGAAGGPKGLILGPLDRFIFSDWLLRSTQPVDLVGGSVGAWRLAYACLDDPAAALRAFEEDYVHQDFKLLPGQKRPSAQQVSAQVAHDVHAAFKGRIGQILGHPRYRLHIVTSHGRRLLAREGPLRTPIGYLGAAAANSVRRRSLGGWIERVVFSRPGAALPFRTQDLRTQQVALNAANFESALLASSSIPFWLAAVHDIPGAPRGAYWDGGVTDYHLHLDYSNTDGLVLYPHFQRAVVPGWLDKPLKRRHRTTAHLNRVLLLAPHPEWVGTLPNAKLPDRTDFARYGQDSAARTRAWAQAASQAQQLADEFAQWLERPDLSVVLPL